ncbi:MAG: MFS transporter [Bacillota bacterium]
MSKKIAAILTLALVYAAAFTPVYMKYVLYEPLLEAFNITNAQSGYLIAVYTILNTILYIPGGFVADKYSLKKILTFSMLGHAVLLFWLSMSLNYTTALIVWFFFGITTGFALWSGLLKGVLSLSDRKDSAIVAGIYGLFGALFTIALNLIFTNIYYNFDNAEKGMSIIFLIASISALIAAILVFIFYKDNKKPVEGGDEFVIAHIKPILKNPVVWIVSIVILAVYAIRVGGNTYFSPLLLDAYNLDSQLVSTLGIVRSNVFPLLAPVAGFIAAKVFKSTTKLLRISFVCLGVMFAILTFFSTSLPVWIAIAFSLLPGLLSGMTFGVAFSVISESAIPSKFMGTAIGIVSMIVYLPDFVFDPVFGTLIDKLGTNGYAYIFGTLVVFAIAGYIASSYLVKNKLVGLENNAEAMADTATVADTEIATESTENA